MKVHSESKRNRQGLKEKRGPLRVFEDKRTQWTALAQASPFRRVHQHQSSDLGNSGKLRPQKPCPCHFSFMFIELSASFQSSRAKRNYFKGLEENS